MCINERVDDNGRAGRKAKAACSTIHASTLVPPQSSTRWTRFCSLRAGSNIHIPHNLLLLLCTTESRCDRVNEFDHLFHINLISFKPEAKGALHKGSLGALRQTGADDERMSNVCR